MAEITPSPKQWRLSDRMGKKEDGDNALIKIPI